jgi:DNA-binding MarR family transcriptional regulator
MDKQEFLERSHSSFLEFTKYFSQLLRQKLADSPITVHQYYTLEALTNGPKSMNAVADDVGMHQSTLTRVLEKLENQQFVRRTRKPGNQRMVEVEITEAGRQLLQTMHAEALRLIDVLLTPLPKAQYPKFVKTMEMLGDLLNPKNENFQRVLKTCCQKD